MTVDVIQAHDISLKNKFLVKHHVNIYKVSFGVVDSRVPSIRALMEELIVLQLLI